MEHPQDCQAGADGVAGLDRDEAANSSGLVSFLQFCRGTQKMLNDVDNLHITAADKNLQLIELERA